MVPGLGRAVRARRPAHAVARLGFEGMGNRSAADATTTRRCGRRDADRSATTADSSHGSATTGPSRSVDVAGPTGVPRTTPTPAPSCVWQTPERQLGQARASTPRSRSRTDEIIAATRRGRHRRPHRRPRSTRHHRPGRRRSYVGSVGRHHRLRRRTDAGVRRSSTSYPPQGGDLPLAGFDWTMVDGEQTANGVDLARRAASAWWARADGTTFTLTEPPGRLHPGRRPLRSAPRPPTAPTADVRYRSSIARRARSPAHCASLELAATIAWDGRCGVYVGRDVRLARAPRRRWRHSAPTW